MLNQNYQQKESPVAIAKKKSTSKKAAPKKSDKAGFYPKIKSTKKNGLGTY